MLCATLFPAPYHSFPILTGGATQTSTWDSLAPSRDVHAGTSLVSRFEFHFQQLRRPRLSLRAARRTASATSKRRGGGARMDDEFSYYYDDDDDDDDDDGVVYSGSEYDEDDDDDVVEGEGMVPLEQMRKWLKNKPRGFGEGRVYDTAVEDKLFEEMRQSREAQTANLKKLKSAPVNTDLKKKDSQVVPIGGRVRLVNLPKKKNIHRDLKVAFEGIPGIVNIVPAVTGNKKTRDPVCKGFAFVDFKHEADAVRFVELYSGQSITFGKIQKQIKCELVNAHSCSSASPGLNENLNAASHLMVSVVEEDLNDESNMEDFALSSWDGATSDNSDDTDNQIYEEEEEEEEEEEGIGENQDSGTALMLDYGDGVEISIDSEINSLSLEQANKNSTAAQKSLAKAKQENAHKKKQTSKEKAKKVPKLDVPGSAKRLKIKEKAVLSDVFSKYGSKAALASKDS